MSPHATCFGWVVQKEREQLAQAQALLAAREKAAKGSVPNPLQFRPRPEFELPPVEAPSLFDDGTLNLMAAAGQEARALDAVASKRNDSMPQWVAAPGDVSASTADAVDSVLAAALHAEEGAAAIRRLAVKRLGKQKGKGSAQAAHAASAAKLTRAAPG